MTDGDRTIATAVRVAEVLHQHEVDAVVIGAIALAVHGYPRATSDIDLAVNTNPFESLREVQRTLRGEGFHTELILPDDTDPLGGVLTVTGTDIDAIQVVNFYNPLSAKPLALGFRAIQTASAGLIPGTPLRVVNLAHLVALKLYAGGAKSKLDVIELLQRNQDADLDGIRAVCAKHGLDGELNRLLSEIGQ